MDKLKINLIPPEVKAKAKKDAKRALGVRISVGLLGVLILITSGILAVIIYQSVTVQALNSEIENQKTAIVKLRNKEAIAFFLKNRIDTINQFALTQNQQSDMFVLINSLFPAGIDLLSLQIDKSDKVQLQAETLSTLSLENLLNSLTDPDENEGRIASVSVDSLNRNQAGLIRFSLTLNIIKKSTE